MILQVVSLPIWTAFPSWMEIQMRYAAEREQRNAELIDQLMKANELILRERTTALALDLALQHKEEKAGSFES